MQDGREGQERLSEGRTLRDHLRDMRDYLTDIEGLPEGHEGLPEGHEGPTDSVRDLPSAFLAISYTYLRRRVPGERPFLLMSFGAHMSQP